MGGVGQISMGAMAEPAFVAYVFRVYGKNQRKHGKETKR